MAELIEFCHIHRLSTALMHLCVSAYGEVGAGVAIDQLRGFYLNVVSEETEN
jgi:hypothetical protein